MRALLLLVPMALLGTACLRPSESRAERDRTVGHAEAQGLRVDVQSGLAAVREVDSGVLHLWASAPSLELVLRRQASAPERWELRVDNCMPDAELTVGEGQPLERRASALPTRCAWSLDLPAQQQVRARVRSARADEPGPFRFGVLSDIQRAVYQVNDIFITMNAAADLWFVLSTGDLTNQGAAAEHARLQRELEALEVPFFTTLGNHELGFSTSAPAYHDWFGRGNLHFEFRDVHFTLLDAASATLDPIVYEWLGDWLALGRDRLHAVGMHIAPLDPVGLRNGGFGSRNEAALLLGTLAEGEVDLTLYGHIHSYYRFENAGIEAHISGGGGGLPERFDSIGRHYLSVEADPRSGTFFTRVVRVD